MSFDPNTFLQQSFEGEASTKTLPVPEGEYPAIIDKVDIKTWQTKDGSNSGLKLELVWDIQDEEVKELLGRSKITSRQQIMLDLTEAGGLDLGKGKNVTLGRLREAIGKADPTAPFSFPEFQGLMAKVAVKHRIDGDNIYDEVRGTTKLA